jgi:hypothetical protein
MTTGFRALARITPRHGVPLFAALGTMAVLGLTGCSSSHTASAPPPGSITNDRSLGDIMVRFNPPPVVVSEDAGKQLAAIKGPIRFVVKRPMSGGVWLVTAISPAADATIDQAVATLKAESRIASAEPDRVLKPNRTQPLGRDMPAE